MIRPRAEEERAGLEHTLLVKSGSRSRLWSVQEDGFSLEDLIATGEAEKGSERVAGRHESHNEDGEDCLAEFELRVVFVKAGKYEVSAAVSARIPRVQLQLEAPYPPKIIHDAAMAMKRQYHGSLAPSWGWRFM